MGLLVRASCIIGLIALYSPVHQTPVDMKPAIAVASAMRNGAGALDAAGAARTFDTLSQAVQTYRALPPDVRTRAIEQVAGAMAPARLAAGQAGRPQP